MANISKNFERRSYLLLLLPAVILYATFIAFPLLFSLFFSVMKWSGIDIPTFIGIDNYSAMIKDPTFAHGVRNNILIVLISVFGQIPLGFMLAYFIFRKIIKGGQFFQAMIFLPVAISAIIVAVLWNQIFAPGGIYTSIIRNITGNQRYIIEAFENKQWAIAPILVVILWYYTGIYLVIFIANMRKIPQGIIESALMEGASEWDIMTKIIAPILSPVFFTTIIFAVSGSLKSFDLIFAMTGGGPANYTDVIAIHMYIHTFKYHKYGYGSAVSVTIMLISLLIIGMLNFVFKKIEKHYN